MTRPPAVLALLACAAASGANDLESKAKEDFAGFYAPVQSVHLTAEMTGTVAEIEHRCHVEYWAQDEMYRYDIDCSSPKSEVTAMSAKVAYDGERTRMFQKGGTVIQSTAGNVAKGPHSAFGPPNPLFAPLADRPLDWTENLQLSGVKAALRSPLEPSRDSPYAVRADDVKDGFPRHLVLTSDSTVYEYRITDMDVNKVVPKDTFALALPGTTEVKTEDVNAEIERRNQQP